MGNLQNMLNAAKKQKVEGNNMPQQQAGPRMPKQQMQEEAIYGDIDSIDEMFFGAPTDDGMELYEQYPNGEARKVYSAEDEMEAIKNGTMSYNAGNSKMPRQILESIINNPLEVSPIEGTASQEIMDEGLQNRTLDIIDKLDSRDRKGKSYVQENRHQQQQMMTEPQQVYMPKQQPQQLNGYNFSINELASLIEGIVDKKFRQYGAGMLTESRNGSVAAPKVGIMTIGENFKFMDETGNVYECTMKYIGKGKVKKN